MKTTIVLLAASLVLVAVPLALADETKADCESGQDWIGYTSTKSLKNTYEGLGSPGGINACEGEHWDGQDQVQPSQNPGTTAPCGPAISGTSPDNLFIGECQNADTMATPGGVDLLGSLTPVGARVSSAGSGTARQVYVGLDIYLVGRVALYQSTLGGSSETGVYLRDNTPGNVLATVVSAAGVTKGYVSEGDCDQTTYNAGAQAGDRTKCGRDNTAITLDLLS